MSLQRGIYTSPTHTVVTAGVASTSALSPNESCQYRLFVNNSTETLYLGFNTAAALNAGIQLNANGGTYEMSAIIGNLYQGQVNVISTSGGKLLLVTEGN